MKITRKELDALIENKIKERLNEALKSDIIRKIVNTSWFKQYGNKLSWLSDIAWDQVQDSDIKIIPVDTARKKIYEAGMIFWFKDNELLAASRGTYIIASPRYKAKLAYSSTLELSRIADKAYFISKEILNNLTVRDKSAQRFQSKQGATALQRASKMKEDNLLRYKNIIAKKKSDNADINIKVKQIMAAYYKKFESLSLDDYYPIQTIGEDIKKLLDLYSRYVYISKDLEKGTAYEHQTIEINDIINQIDKKLAKI